MASELTQAEKLEALVRKAIDNGWSVPIGIPEGFVPAFKVLPKAHLVLFNYTNSDAPSFDLEKSGVGSFTTTTETVIFNHDLVRALFGVHRCVKTEASEDGVQPDILCKVCDGDELSPWQYYLQQAVVADNPIDYMYQAAFGATGGAK